MKNQVITFLFIFYTCFKTTISQSKTISCPISSNEDCICTEDVSANKIIDCSRLKLTQVPDFETDSIIYTELNLNGNQIGNLVENSFMNLRVKRILLDSNNVISNVHDNAFEGQDSLTELLLGVESSVTFRKEIFLKLSNQLEKLTLQGFTFTNSMLSNNDGFENFYNLKELSIIGSNLNQLEVRTLPSNGLLLKLDLSDNSFESIPSIAADGMKSLLEMTLSHNKLTVLNNNAFNGLDKLIVLKLAYNQITKIESDSLRPLKKLREINLMHNKLTGENLLDIEQLEDLRLLNLDSNQLGNFPQSVLIKTSKLTKLTLVDCGINELNYLHIKGTENSLEEINLNNNREFSVLHKDTFKLHAKLKRLYLSNSKLSGTLTTEHFQGIISNTLVELDLSSTPLLQTDLLSIKTLKSLVDLKMENCQLALIPSWLFTDKKTTTIDFSNNPIDSLDKNTFAGLAEYLENVFLRSTRLSTVSRCVFNGFKKLKKIDLNNVDLHCDCRLNWLHKFLQDRKLDENWLCKSPSILAGEKFYDLESEDLTCSSGIVDETNCNNLEISTQPSNQINAFRMRLVNVTNRAITVVWNLTGKYKESEIENFKIQYTNYNELSRINIGKSIDIIINDVGLRRQIVNDLTANTEYLICISLKPINVNKINGGDEFVEKTCDSTFTTNISEVKSSSSTLAIILGVIFGILFLIVILIIVFICLKKSKFKNCCLLNGDSFYEKPYASPKLEFPQIGRDSKRYWRSRSSKANSTQSVDTNITSVSAFSPYPYPPSVFDELTVDEKDKILLMLARPDSSISQDERYKIMNKLTTSGVSTLSRDSAHSAGASSIGPKLPPRPQDLEGYLTPQELRGESKVYNGDDIYCEINLPDNYGTSTFKESYI